MEVLDERLIRSRKSKNNTSRSKLIEEYMPFIISEISKVTGRYVSYENSMELSVGLMAFDEAIDKYQSDKGSFTNFASLVIGSRVRDFLRKNNYYEQHVPVKENEEFGEVVQFVEDPLKEEVSEFNDILDSFNIDIETLVEESPTHQKTRRENIKLGRDVSKEEPIVKKLYRTKKLPMADIVLKFKTTKKKLKYHRNFLISVIVVFNENLSNIMEFMNLGGSSND